MAPDFGHCAGTWPQSATLRSGFAAMQTRACDVRAECRYRPAGGRGFKLGAAFCGGGLAGTMMPGSSSTSCGWSTDCGDVDFCRDETEFNCGPSVDGATGVNADWPLRPLYVINPSLVETISPGRRVGSVFTSKVASPNASLPLQVQLATRCLR